MPKCEPLDLYSGFERFKHKGVAPNHRRVHVRIKVRLGIQRVIRRYAAHNKLQEEVGGSAVAFLTLGREDQGFQDGLSD